MKKNDNTLGGSDVLMMVYFNADFGPMAPKRKSDSGGPD
jgi:hypothetical protein